MTAPTSDAGWSTLRQLEAGVLSHTSSHWLLHDLHWRA